MKQVNIMKARKVGVEVSSHENEKNSDDLESALVSLDEDQPKIGYQNQSLSKFLIKIASDFIFYAGAWCFALWILYFFSQVVHNNSANNAAKGFRDGWNRLLADEQINNNNNSLVSGYIETIQIPRLDSNHHHDINSNYLVSHSLPSLPSSSIISNSNDHNKISHQNELTPTQNEPYPLYQSSQQQQQQSTTMTKVENKISQSQSTSFIEKTKSSPERSLTFHQNKDKIISKKNSIGQTIDKIETENSYNKKENNSLETLCRSVHKRYNVLPGKSWGTLSKQQQKDWMNNRCDQFFCEPHAMEGRGVYKCTPLKR
mmetsp:Transcript_13507/g.16090  ORF Transcript_13507/g.16090 Transcript_13507/m.16090 type:complete len:315 (+) Transcript_13507:63-1007(+)